MPGKCACASEQGGLSASLIHAIRECAPHRHTCAGAREHVIVDHVIPALLCILICITSALRPLEKSRPCQFVIFSKSRSAKSGGIYLDPTTLLFPQPLFSLPIWVVEVSLTQSPTVFALFHVSPTSLVLRSGYQPRILALPKSTTHPQYACKLSWHGGSFLTS